MLEAHYAQAVLQLLSAPKADVKAVAAGLEATLARRGHSALLPRILAQIERTRSRRAGKGAVQVRIANASAKKEALAKAKELAGDMETEVVEDESLIAGFAVEGPGFRFDASSRAALLNLYRTLVN